MKTTRRRMLQSLTGAAALSMVDGPWFDGPWLRGLAAIETEPPPDIVRFGPDLEPLVRLIEDTPREQCVPVFIDQLQRGLSYRRFLAAAYFACVRREHSHHDVYKIHSVHQVSQ